MVGKFATLAKSLLSGDRIALSKAITLIESSSPRHEKEAEKIIDEILPFSGKSLRIGITGVPGVGKSTFIEAFGNYLIQEKKKTVAVLAIDPTSTINKGSILGDKTRMENLSKSENAFIRPSPSSGTMGGVASKTREAILLCEAAGFDIIIVETVGVGQSETSVHSMVDFLLLLLLPGAGDELQGMKRGIVELADLIAINKADGSNLQKVKLAQAAYRQALHLFPPKESGWKPEVLTCSALAGIGIDKIWKVIEEFEKESKASKSFYKKRKEQNKYWFRQQVNASVYRLISQKAKLLKLDNQVEEGGISVIKAAREVTKHFKS